MDEKGIQLGIWKKILVMVDHDQETIHQVEDGNHKLVTVIKCVCANGTSTPSSVVFQGAQHNLEWGRDNPCNAR
jgi:hypothetical protein